MWIPVIVDIPPTSRPDLPAQQGIGAGAGVALGDGGEGVAEVLPAAIRPISQVEPLDQVGGIQFIPSV